MTEQGSFGHAELAALLRPLNGALKIVLAVSGGPDSVALMHLTARWRSTRARPDVIVASVDHGLRASAAAEARAVHEWALDLGFDHHTLVWRGDKKPSQEAARTARYQLLTRFATAAAATHLVTAHTLDDQAETILFRLARGSGPIGLVGMRPQMIRDGIVLVRPLLTTPKARLQALVRANNWPFFDDPSNADPRFARSRLRKLMPLIANEGLTGERLARFSARMEAVTEALDRSARQVHATALREAGPTMRQYWLAVMMAEPAAVLVRVLAIALHELSPRCGDPFGPRLERLEALVERLRQAHRTGGRFAQTLAGAKITIGSDTLTVARETVRRRGFAPPRRDGCGGV
jgi:tRNA(Ile)-lysidine synthase